MDNDFEYDRFDDEGRGERGHPAPRPRAPSRKPRSRGLMLGIAVIGVLLIGGFVAWAYLAGDDQTAGTELPVVTADRSPYKVRPEEPGGMDVPNQDKEVYERISGEGEGEDVERLLPPADEAEAPAVAEGGEAANEEGSAAGDSETGAGTVAGDNLTPPPPPPVDTTGEAAQQTAADKAGETAQQAGEAAGANGQPTALANDSQTAQVNREELPPPPGAKTEESAPAAPASGTSPSQTQTETPTETQAPAASESAPQPSQPAATSAPAADGAYRVQVASIQDRSKAESSWKAMQNKHEDLLGGLSLSVVEVEIEGRGTFYRLQGGGVSRDRAEEICATLKQRNAGCLIVRP